MKIKKMSKHILAFLLSAALLAEPACGTTLVYATEQNADQMSVEDGGENENPDGAVDEDASDGQENGVTDGESVDAETENPDNQEESGENDADQSEADDTASDGETPEDWEPAEGQDEADRQPAEEQPGQDAEDGEEISVSDNALEEETQEELDADKFSEMPSSYMLSSEQKEMKMALSASMEQFDASQEGKTYVERQVFAFADTREEAEDIADAYCAELIEYDEGVVVLKLTKDTSVGEALMAASDIENNLPAVYPDYYRYVYGEEMPQENASLTVAEEEYEPEDASPDTVLTEEPSLEAYAEAVQDLGEPNMSYDSTYYQWQHVNVGSVYAWKEGYKGNHIKVAVLDTGVTPSEKDSLHCDIQVNKTEEENWLDGHGHGTHVAGIIGAQLDGMGGAGIAPEAEIVNVKVMNNKGAGNDSNIIQGINYAKSENVDIINMSLGGIGYNPAVEKVIDQAYESGIAVFVASGNNGGNNMTYPAALENVICVSAVDNNNQRASFANYGPWVDLSAPGVNIWSIGINTANNGYKVLSGTSQATPVAAGEAAVILSAGLDRIPVEKSGEKVDALKRVMQENTVPAGSGMGKGVTSLTKVFNLAVAAEKPKAPTIECVDTSNDTAQSLAIKMKAQTDMQIFYTTNGKNPVCKNGEAGLGTEQGASLETITVSGKTAAKGTVKAMAVSPSGAVSPIKSVTWTLKPYVEEIVISGPTRVEKKKAIQLKAAVTPVYATKKDVMWTLQTEDGKPVDETRIKIDSKRGKITTTEQAAAGKYKVTVTAQDNPDANTAAKAEYTIEVIESNTTIQQITFQDKPSNPIKKVLWLRQHESNTEWDEVSLFDYVVAKEKDLTAQKGTPLKEIADREALKGRLQWTSSKPAVASVDAAGKVTGKMPGTTTITVKADDNLGKKTTITITVKNAVTKITITSDKDKYGDTEEDYPTVARGKSIALKAQVFPEKPANKKINWSIAPGPDNNATAEDMKNVTINKTNGRITVKAKAKAGQYVVTAEAADGQKASAAKTIVVVGGAISDITLANKADRNVTLYTKEVSAEKVSEKEIAVFLKGVKGECDPKAYKVTNSNESVVRVAGIVYSPSETEGIVSSLRLQMQATGNRYGKANIVVAATDGSKKKAAFSVTVKGGIRKVELVDAQSKRVGRLTLFRKGTAATAPSTAELYAKISNSEGANTQAYSVTSNNSLVKVTGVDKDTGKISLEAGQNATGKATITLTATDGSRKKTTCTVTVVNPVSKIHIAPKSGNRNYVAKGKSLQLQATLESEYGAVSNKKVIWELTGGNNVSINRSGKISAKKDATGTGSSHYVTVTAKACDGSNAQAKYTVYITTEPVDYLYLSYKGTTLDTKACRQVKLIRQTDDQEINDRDKLGGYYQYDLVYGDTKTLRGGVAVSSSKPDVMSAMAGTVSGKNVVRVSADKVGTATITIKAMDGSGKQVKYKFKVVEP